MKILNIKYKMHRLINIAFYFVVFAIGFLIGGGHIEKISNVFNNFIK